MSNFRDVQHNPSPFQGNGFLPPGGGETPGGPGGARRANDNSADFEDSLLDDDMKVPSVLESDDDLLELEEEVDIANAIKSTPGNDVVREVEPMLPGWDSTPGAADSLSDETTEDEEDDAIEPEVKAQVVAAVAALPADAPEEEKKAVAKPIVAKKNLWATYKNKAKEKKAEAPPEKTGSLWDMLASNPISSFMNAVAGSNEEEKQKQDDEDDAPGSGPGSPVQPAPVADVPVAAAAGPGAEDVPGAGPGAKEQEPQQEQAQEEEEEVVKVPDSVSDDEDDLGADEPQQAAQPAQPPSVDEKHVDDAPGSPEPAAQQQKQPEEEKAVQSSPQAEEPVQAANDDEPSDAQDAPGNGPGSAPGSSPVAADPAPGADSQDDAAPGSAEQADDAKAEDLAAPVAANDAPAAVEPAAAAAAVVDEVKSEPKAQKPAKAAAAQPASAPVKKTKSFWDRFKLKNKKRKQKEKEAAAAAKQAIEEEQAPSADHEPGSGGSMDRAIDAAAAKASQSKAEFKSAPSAGDDNDDDDDDVDPSKYGLKKTPSFWDRFKRMGSSKRQALIKEEQEKAAAEAAAKAAAEAAALAEEERKREEEQKAAEEEEAARAKEEAEAAARAEEEEKKRKEEEEAARMAAEAEAARKAAEEEEAARKKAQEEEAARQAAEEEEKTRKGSLWGLVTAGLLTSTPDERKEIASEKKQQSAGGADAGKDASAGDDEEAEEEEKKNKKSTPKKTASLWDATLTALLGADSSDEEEDSADDTDGTSHTEATDNEDDDSEDDSEDDNEKEDNSPVRARSLWELVTGATPKEEDKQAQEPQAVATPGDRADEKVFEVADFNEPGGAEPGAGAGDHDDAPGIVLASTAGGPASAAEHKLAVAEMSDAEALEYQVNLTMQDLLRRVEVGVTTEEQKQRAREREIRQVTAEVMQSMLQQLEMEEKGSLNASAERRLRWGADQSQPAEVSDVGPGMGIVVEQPGAEPGMGAAPGAEAAGSADVSHADEPSASLPIELKIAAKKGFFDSDLAAHAAAQEAAFLSGDNNAGDAVAGDAFASPPKPEEEEEEAEAEPEPEPVAEPGIQPGHVVDDNIADILAPAKFSEPAANGDIEAWRNLASHWRRARVVSSLKLYTDFAPVPDLATTCHATSVTYTQWTQVNNAWKAYNGGDPSIDPLSPTLTIVGLLQAELPQLASSRAKSQLTEALSQLTHSFQSLREQVKVVAALDDSIGTVDCMEDIIAQVVEDYEQYERDVAVAQAVVHECVDIVEAMEDLLTAVVGGKDEVVQQAAGPLRVISRVDSAAGFAVMKEDEQEAEAAEAVEPSSHIESEAEDQDDEDEQEAKGAATTADEDSDEDSWNSQHDGQDRTEFLRSMSQMRNTPAYLLFPKFVQKEKQPHRIDAAYDHEMDKPRMPDDEEEENEEEVDLSDADDDVDEHEDLENIEELFEVLDLDPSKARSLVNQDYKVSDLLRVTPAELKALVPSRTIRLKILSYLKQRRRSLMAGSVQPLLQQEMRREDIPNTLDDLLKLLKIPSRYLASFDTHDVRMSNLTQLQKKTLRAIIPPRGPRTRFKEWVRINATGLRRRRNDFLRVEKLQDAKDKLHTHAELRRWKLKEETRLKRHADHLMKKDNKSAWRWAQSVAGDEMLAKQAQLQAEKKERRLQKQPEYRGTMDDPDADNQEHRLYDQRFDAKDNYKEAERWESMLRAAESGHASVEQVLQWTVMEDEEEEEQDRLLNSKVLHSDLQTNKYQDWTVTDQDMATQKRRRSTKISKYYAVEPTGYERGQCTTSECIIT